MCVCVCVCVCVSLCVLPDLGSLGRSKKYAINWHVKQKLLYKLAIQKIRRLNWYLVRYEKKWMKYYFLENSHIFMQHTYTSMFTINRSTPKHTSFMNMPTYNKMFRRVIIKFWWYFLTSLHTFWITNFAISREFAV